MSCVPAQSVAQVLNVDSSEASLALGVCFKLYENSGLLLDSYLFLLRGHNFTSAGECNSTLPSSHSRKQHNKMQKQQICIYLFIKIHILLHCKTNKPQSGFQKEIMKLSVKSLVTI